MKNIFPLFQSHLDLAHYYWSKLIEKGDTVIDATCGNGHDTVKLCQLALSHDMGQVYAFDIQAEAIDSAKRHLSVHLSSDLQKRIEFQLRSHATFPESLKMNSVKLIAYNLGYLPGGDKTKTTQHTTTLQSLQKAAYLIAPSGAICVTCYPGHPEGAMEQEAVLAFASELSPKEWSCCHHVWMNRNLAPSLLLIQRTVKADNSPVAEQQMINAVEG